ncbi:hypothetical protein WJX73_008801 [Symbiochloris irregularis]|uniref:Alpha-type protein kinase domain-containing protein n=1 Tax=Symbiochloris irregularis TaxID=706552 RepID=A0AAW1NRJ0_9CHLO
MLEQIRQLRGLEIKTIGAACLKIAPSPFSDRGMIRWPFYAKLVHCSPAAAEALRDSKAFGLVAKRFKDPIPESGQDRQELKPKNIHSKQRYFSQMEVQSVAAALAQEFNQISREKGGKEIRFAPIAVFAAGTHSDGMYFSMEKELPGLWIRFINNYGYINKEEEEQAAAIHAFSHWTYHRTGGLLLVTDLLVSDASFPQQLGQQLLRMFGGP